MWLWFVTGVIRSWCSPSPKATDALERRKALLGCWSKPCGGQGISCRLQIWLWWTEGFRYCHSHSHPGHFMWQPQYSSDSSLLLESQKSPMELCLMEKWSQLNGSCLWLSSKVSTDPWRLLYWTSSTIIRINTFIQWFGFCHVCTV